MISKQIINSWTTDKSHEVMQRIFDAAKRDFSVNNGEIPEIEVEEAMSVMGMIEEDMANYRAKLNSSR